MHSRIPRPCLSYRLPAFPRTCLCPLRSLSYCSATAQAIAQPLLMDAKRANSPRHAPCREFLLWNLFVKYANLRNTEMVLFVQIQQCHEKVRIYPSYVSDHLPDGCCRFVRAQHPLQPGTQDRYDNNEQHRNARRSPQFPSSGRLFQDFSDPSITCPTQIWYLRRQKRCVWTLFIPPSAERTG
jgi:hypothetical protein